MLWTVVCSLAQAQRIRRSRRIRSLSVLRASFNSWANGANFISDFLSARLKVDPLLTDSCFGWWICGRLVGFVSCGTRPPRLHMIATEAGRTPWGYSSLGKERRGVIDLYLP